MKISIAMRTFNGATYVREQLDSIFAQTRLPDELIACDDDSVDGSASILEEYARRSPFPMKVVVNKPRLGSTPNLEQVLRFCSGDIIALSDQDDIWHPNKLAVVEQRFEAHQEVGLFFTNADLINERGETLPGDLWTRFKFGEERQALLAADGAYDLLLSHSFITGATAAFRSPFKSLFLPLPMPDLPNFMHDRWMIILVAATSRLGFIEDKLMSYRLHRQQQAGVGNFAVFLRHAIENPLSKEAIALAAIRQRLTRDPEWSPKPTFMEALSVRQEHVAAMAFPRSPIGRLQALAAEYQSNRYQLYSGSFRDALRYLVVG